MKITSTKMPANQDFGLGISDTYQAARRFASSNPSTKTLMILDGEARLSERHIDFKNKSSVFIVTSLDELSTIDIGSFDFFVYGPNAVDKYFGKINSK